MNEPPPKAYSDNDLLTIREVARLLKIKPDTLYRWARKGRMEATKVGKEWRVTVGDIEKLVGRAIPRTPYPGVETEAEEAELSVNGARTTTLGSEHIERRLRNFLNPRDNIMVLASGKEDLVAFERSFWKVALQAGGPLLITIEPGRAKAVRKALNDSGFNTRGLTRSGRLVLAEVQSLDDARRAMRIESGKGATVWTTFGMANSLAVPRNLALEHAHELDAACVTNNAIIMSGWVINKKEWSPSDIWKLEVAHRGLVRVWEGDALFSRYV